MPNRITNLPIDTSKNSTVESFDNYFLKPIEVDSNVLAAMQGYFESKGFGQVSAESIATTIIYQAKQDGYNPMQILDTLKGLTDVDLSGLVAEILNYNRLATSSLGYAQPFRPNPEISRNIIA